MSKKSGKVYLIGAGPGDPGLLTLRGKELLEASEVIIYDALINQKILSWAQPSAKKIYAGKKLISNRLNPQVQKENRKYQQDEINQLMVHYAKAGKIIARLKGGDPFLFGRGGEEAEFLSSRRVPFEIVPGVTSAIAVPAYAGIPITDRRYNSMLTIMTGHLGQENHQDPKIDWSHISPNGTLVILMGMSKLKIIIQKLIKQGWKNSLPIACIRWGTTSQQQVVIGTLKDILQKLKLTRPKFSSPVIIVIGHVVELKKKISWFNSKN